MYEYQVLSFFFSSFWECAPGKAQTCIAVQQHHSGMRRDYDSGGEGESPHLPINRSQTDVICCPDDYCCIYFWGSAVDGHESTSQPKRARRRWEAERGRARSNQGESSTAVGYRKKKLRFSFPAHEKKTEKQPLFCYHREVFGVN